jgi:hypothetical protein
MAKANRPKLGFSEQPTAHLVAAREQVYADVFGDRFTVSHELLPLVPHIDVYVFEPDDDRGRDFFTLVTGGMSDLPMGVPDGVPCCGGWPAFRTTSKAGWRPARR